jgi:hypothetical protein
MGDTVVAQSSYKDGAGSNASWGEESLQVSIQECAVTEDCNMKIEVWNENAPASDTLISEYLIPLAELTGVQDEEFDLKLDLFRRKKPKRFAFMNKLLSRKDSKVPSTSLSTAEDEGKKEGDDADEEAEESEHHPGGTFTCKILTEIDLGIEGAESEIVIQAVNMTATGLPETELGFLAGKQDPYIILKLASSKAQSKYIDGGGTDVDWGKEELVLEASLEDMRSESLILQVWNENAPAPDVLIGETSMPAAALTDFMRKDYSFSRTIQRPGKDPKGTVNMTLRCLPGRLHPSRRAENEARASRKALEEARKLEMQVDRYFDITIASSTLHSCSPELVDILGKHHTSLSKRIPIYD